jgi:hypothetical protein
MVDPIPESLLSLSEILLEAQLKAIRRVRHSGSSAVATSPRRRGAPRSGNSQLDIVYNILRAAGHPLHISEIIARAAAAGSPLERDSVVSALSKRIAHSDRFRRTAPNTFALLTTEAPKP